MSKLINLYRESLKNNEDNETDKKNIDLLDDNLLFDKKIENISGLLQNISESKVYDKLPLNLSFHTNFSKSGKQGLLGLLNVNSDEKEDNKCVYKFSQHINFLVAQEYEILKSLTELREFCPHFCRTYGKIKVKMNSEYKNVENPFKLNGNYNIHNDVLLLEYIDNARKFYRYIKNTEIEEEVLYSIVKQTLLALSIAQNKKKLTHYDLHSNNVLIKTCNPNSLFLYVLDEKRQYLVPTYGYYPVIIDFGFGYCNSMEGGPLYGPLAHTDVGFMTHINDKIADPKLFLVTVSDEIKKYRDSKKSKLFRRLVKNIFEPLNIDFESGWDNYEGKNCSDTIYGIVRIDNKRSEFFKQYGHYCIDILQSLITLPLKKRKYKERHLQDLYKIIVEEFMKIENEVGSKFYLLYIFKNCVEIAIKYKQGYIKCQDAELAKVIRSYKNDVLEKINGVIKFFNPKEVNWEKLLGGMIGFACQMEGVINDILTPRLAIKEQEYEQMELKNIEEIYEAIEANIPAHFYFEKDTEIYVWDCVKEVSLKLKTLPEEVIDKLNKQHPLERGRLLYTYYKKIN